jgi:hypothetical protein
MENIIADLEAFAAKHGLTLEKRGEVGFGRPCVGFIKGSSYVDHNALSHDDFRPLSEFEDDHLYAPDGVNSYHKHDCLAVLVEADDWENIPDVAYDEALRQLHTWIKHLESLGSVEVVRYTTGASGLQAFVTGAVGYALRITDGAGAGRGDSNDSPASAVSSSPK